MDGISIPTVVYNNSQKNKTKQLLTICNDERFDFEHFLSEFEDTGTILIDGG